MNQLIKQMMVKPTVTKIDPVEVIQKYFKEKSADVIENSQGLNLKAPGKATIIVDKTNQGYDREAMLQKLNDHKKQINQPILDIIVEGPIIKSKNPNPIINPIIKKKPVMIIEEDTDEEGEKEITTEKVPPIVVEVPKKKPRKTKKPEKGIATLGAIVAVDFGDASLIKRLPVKQSPINIKVSNYVMNNRETFINFINQTFEPYKHELANSTENISCDNMGKSSSSFSLLTHQKIVRDYMNLYTPYRGLLLYHGLGSGKTCTSIAIAEGMKDTKKVIIMSPASLHDNYVSELKKCGDLLYKKHQFWEWVSNDEHPESIQTMSAVLNLPQEFIRKHHGAFFVNAQNPSNYEDMDDKSKSILEAQLNLMIDQKYSFIHYNGLRNAKLNEMTSNFTVNIFDNSVVIIDEAHNFISLIVNSLKKEKPIQETKRGEKESLPLSRNTKLYEMLLIAKNARIVLLTGTPIVNYPHEFSILFNILRGYIKTWKIPLNIETSVKIDRTSLQQMLLGEKVLDYLDYSPSSKILTITKNPFGFKNEISKSGYKGVYHYKNDKTTGKEIMIEDVNDELFEKHVIRILGENGIKIGPSGIDIKHKKSLPDKLDDFAQLYINSTTRELNNPGVLSRRIVGLSSYFRSAQENLLPTFNKILNTDYFIVKIDMSDTQFKQYELARTDERKAEKKKKNQNVTDDYKEQSSTYRIFSRLYCNYVIPDRPIPIRVTKSKEGDEDADEDADDLDVPVEEKGKDRGETNIEYVLKKGKHVESKQNDEGDDEGEIEGDQILDNVGGITYKERLQNKLAEMEQNPEKFFTKDALDQYSPKFLNVLENIQDEENIGLHLVYTQFRTAEGIGLFSMVLNANGFAQFKIKKNTLGLWEIQMNEEDKGKPTYALYTGTESREEKEIMRLIYNGEWEDIPVSISSILKDSYENNNYGEVIKVFMITSSGSEGINLRNTRFVHLMDPYWHPVRSEQVIGRARRICSHKNLPIELQTVNVFVYLMQFSAAQLSSDAAIELKRQDLSKALPKVPFTSDQYLFELSEIKAKLSSQLTDLIKQSAFDCYLYSTDGKCFNVTSPDINKHSYVPDYTDQPNDAIIQTNKVAITWQGKPININGVDYVSRADGPQFIIYDKTSYENALKDPQNIPIRIGILKKNEQGNFVLIKNG
jgi:hypothetical protein